MEVTMPKSRWLAVCLLLSAVIPLQVGAQRTGYPSEEFTARRQALVRRLGEGTVLLFGNTMPTPGVRFRQDNDFYYFTGNEDLNAALVIDAADGASHLFLPKQGASEIRALGPNWLEDPEAAKKNGFGSIQPLSALNEFLARRRGAGGSRTLWLRMSERDEVDDSRMDTAISIARRSASPWGAYPSEDAWRVSQLRGLFPYYEFKDATAEIDRLRMVKTPREIEVLKRNGAISAEAIRRAMASTRPGRFEYEIEAEAVHHMLRNGVQGHGYPPIVGSGPNGNVWHYQANGRRLQDGEMVVMDYGGSLDYLVIDITRTWPVSGKFDDFQLRAYQCALEAEKAIISSMRPGATRRQTRDIGKAIYEKYGFQDQMAPGAGHFVGMSVHDVGDSSLPFAAGMVIAVEPIIDIKARQLHVRVEDTVLVTDGAPLILTSGVPKEVDDVLTLLAGGRK
jgi:Xaa-Pro aminopeptidase